MIFHEKMNLPDNVLEALRGRQKIKAIRLLREQHGISLKEAKDIVDQYLSREEDRFSGMENPIPKKAPDKKYKNLLPGVLVIATFVWAMINFIEVAGSVIVLWHRDKYQESSFVISKVHYSNDDEAGLTWGFIGRLSGSEEEYRMYAPRLADAEALGHQKLMKMYPPGMQIKVWYNPEVTTTLFQHRTLHIIPYTPDLVNTELNVIYHWLLYCLLPFAGAFLFARVMEKQR